MTLPPVSSKTAPHQLSAAVQKREQFRHFCIHKNAVFGSRFRALTPAGRSNNPTAGGGDELRCSRPGLRSASGCGKAIGLCDQMQGARLLGSNRRPPGPPYAGMTMGR